MIPLISVVEDHIQNHLNSRFVQGFDHISEFLDVLSIVFGDAVSLMRCKITNGAVSPVIHQFFTVVLTQHIGVVEAERRQ